MEIIAFADESGTKNQWGQARLIFNFSSIKGNIYS
jgi:hypothetical protein